MSDFYSVLKQSIIDRDLRSASDREEAYAQARTAMIRRLWSYDPPLADDEIDSRIGLFDTAVDRIESDLIEVFAESDTRAGGTATAPKPARAAAAVIDGYDVEADDVPAFRGRPPADAQAGALPDDDDNWSEASRPPRRRDPVDDRSRAIEAALRLEAADAERADEPETAWDEPPEAFADEPEDDRHEPDDDRRDEPVADEADEDEAREDFADEQPPAGPPRSASRAPATDQRRIRMLFAAVAALAVILVGVTIFAFRPGEFVDTDPSGEDDIGALVRRTVSGPEDATRIPAEALNVERTYTLFDGRDPTIFLADADNPVQFAGDTNSGIATISTSTGSQGVRAIVGPGVATRLAGRTVRIMIVARSSRELGASSLRFAYQSGVAISHWQTAKLSADFMPLGLVWRLPAMRTDPANDLIIIEPGIPGDGTSADIQSIKIDLVRE